MHVYFRDNIDSLHSKGSYCLETLSQIMHCLFVFFQKSIAIDLFLHWRQLQRPLQKLGQQQLFAKVAVVVQRLALSAMMDWESDEYFDSSSCSNYCIQKLNYWNGYDGCSNHWFLQHGYHSSYCIQKLNWKLATTNRDLTKKNTPEK